MDTGHPRYIASVTQFRIGTNNELNFETFIFNFFSFLTFLIYQFLALKKKTYLNQYTRCLKTY